MCLSIIVSEIFNIVPFKSGVRLSMTLKMALFDQSVIVCIALSYTIFEIVDIEVITI